MTNYKSTLNLPKTEFPMKADLPIREPLYLKEWEEKKIYQKLIQKNEGKPKFILHDGPPYANGQIHFGHILNKILKDIIIKYKNMAGFYSPFIPGWDCHGLPIELGALKELSAKEQDKNKLYDPLVRREACRHYAHQFIKDQKKDFKRLGIFGEWERPYLTLTNQYEADIAKEFVRLYTNDYVYKGDKPVYWCISCRTALAEAEVEYEDVSSPSIYVDFKLKNPEPLKLVHEPKVSFVIWTTTPWTLPANLALAIGASYEYVALKTLKGIFIVAKDLKEAFLQSTGLSENVKEVGHWRGVDLSDLKLVCDHPFMKRDSPVVLGDHVTLEAGTGIVHIAPGHGQEDYVIGQKYKLETLCPVDAAGRFIEGAFSEARYPEVKEWEGKKVKEINKDIVDFLFRNKILLNQPGQQLSHSYPHCWRCKKSVIFRATEQWFLELDHHDLRKRALQAITGQVRWIPSWGQDRIYGMIENRPDWCLSRQRVWGVPIIVHYCQECQSPLLNQEIGQFIVGIFEQRGADAWWVSEEPLLPPGTKCSCGGEKFIKEKSILDVWFDSGVSHAAVLEKDKLLGSPADLYLEGSDQHRGWFHSSLLTSLASRQRPPYKAVLTHGFVVDGNGKKYSKSAKNYIPPEKVLNELGAELLRLWVAAEDYRNDIRVSSEIIKVLAEIYRKIRNTCRFILGNLYDFDPRKNSIPFEKRTELDRYAMSLLAQVIQKVEQAYENYEFHVVHHTLNKFFTVDLSAFYLDILKDRLYCDRVDGKLRRSAQSTIYDILISVLPLMSPILSFTAEEVWQFLPFKNEEVPSVFLTQWPERHKDWIDKDIGAKWTRIGLIRDDILKALEVARMKKEIAHPLEAKVILSAEGEPLSFIREYEQDWSQICIVSQVEIYDEVAGYQYKSPSIPSLTVSVERAGGHKCERCWNYSIDVGTHDQHSTLCGRCVEVLKGV